MAKSKKQSNTVGGWAFLVGVILAVVLGALGPLTSTWTIVLVILGLIVGLLNVSASESSPFLLSGVVLIIASAFGGDVLTAVTQLGGIFNALLAIFVPATIVVAIRNAFSLARQ